MDAARWFKNGDHPQDNCGTFIGSDGMPFQGEGQVVRRFRHPEMPGGSRCGHCNTNMHGHGWIDSGGDGRTVCPGDFIVSLDGEFYPLKSDTAAVILVAFAEVRRAALAPLLESLSSVHERPAILYLDRFVRELSENGKQPNNWGRTTTALLDSMRDLLPGRFCLLCLEKVPEPFKFYCCGEHQQEHLDRRMGKLLPPAAEGSGS